MTQEADIDLGNNVKISRGGMKGFVIKYKPIEIKNVIVKEVKEMGAEISSVVATKDGGYIVSGKIGSESIDLGNGVIVTGNGQKDKMIVKYSRTGRAEWAKTIKGGYYYNDSVSVEEVSGGGYIVGCEEKIIKYDKTGKIEWEKRTGSRENLICETDDGGYIGSWSGKLIKLDKMGNEEWTKTSFNAAESLTTTSDGGYLVAGGFRSDSLNLGNGIILTSHENNMDGIIIKYNRDGEVEWAKGIGGEYSDYINSAIETNDGGFLVGGYFDSNIIELEEGIKLSNSKQASSISNAISNGMLIKYNKEGKIEWAREVGRWINKIVKTSDNGYTVSGNFQNQNINFGNGVKIESDSDRYNYDGMVIKYDKLGEIEWAKRIGKNITSATKLNDGSYIAGGNFESKIIELENGETVETLKNGLVKLKAEMGAPEVEELIIENERKEFKITTHVKRIDGIKGGDISGENEKVYEMVGYRNNSTKEIKIIPDENFEIISITINGEEYQFEANEDGTYTMPGFENMTEDKHIEVTFSHRDNKIVINKLESKSKVPLKDAMFKLDQIEERTNPENVIGELTDNGQEYLVGDINSDVSDVLGELTNNGTYYFVNQDGKYVPTNSKTYQVNNVEGATTGVRSSTASSYIPIDLTDKTGNYIVVANAQTSCNYSNTYGYATITNTQTAPNYGNSTGRFIYITRTKEKADYTSMVLEGGKKYYLHLGYTKGYTSDSGSDQIIFNSIKVYKASQSFFNFINNNGRYESSNQGYNNTISNSYVPIDLTGFTGKYNLTVNAQISAPSNGAAGYATITQDTERTIHTEKDGRIIYLTGEQEAKDYTTVLQGGKKYYLHLGYYKNEYTGTGEDKFTVNSIKITTNDSELYHTEVTTNSEGQAITQIPFGKYQITEIKSPEGYELNEEPTIVEFREGGNHEFTIENKKLGNIIVHHYKKGTTESVSPDETYTGKQDEKYETKPCLTLKTYDLEKGEDGNYIIPENATGTYKYETQEIIYYYVEKEIPLVVHHYIEGTTTPVPLKDGTEAQDITKMGKEGDSYQTQEIEDSLLDEKYKLVEIPENNSGVYGEEPIEVIYYYQKVQGDVTINKYCEDGITPLTGVKFSIYNKAEGNRIIVHEMQNDSTYYFSKQGTKYISNNQNMHGTTAHSYIKIDTTKLTRKTIVTINAEVSSESVDYGYATITENTDVPSYYDSNGQFIKISGTQSGKDYETELDPGKVYYLHLGYRKDGSVNKGIDTFTINSIKIDNTMLEELYPYTTDEQGQIRVELEAGNWIAEEIEAPEKYILPENAQHEFTINKETKNVELNIINEKKDGKVIVHHYIEGTTMKLSEDVNIVGKVDEPYETSPATDIPDIYELSRIPENKNGNIEVEDTEVIYYYKAKGYNLNLTKYEKGTDKKLPNVKFKITEVDAGSIRVTTNAEGIASARLKQGYTYKLEEYKTVEGYELNANPITFKTERVDGKLVIEILEGNFKETQEEIVVNNADGEIPEISVSLENETLFKLIKQGEEETTLLPNAKFVIKEIVGEGETATEEEAKDSYGNPVGEEETINGETLRVVTTDEKGELNIALKAGKYKAIEVEAPEGYEIKENNEYYFEIGKGSSEDDNNQPFIIDMGEDFNGQIANIVKLNDGSHIVAGRYEGTITIPAENTASNEPIESLAEGNDGFIIKYKEEGKAEWIKNIGSRDWDGIYGLTSTEDGGYIVVGDITGTVQISAGQIEVTPNDDYIDGAVAIKYNFNDEVEWVTKLDVDDNEGYSENHKVVQTQTNEYIVLGYADSEMTIPAEKTQNNNEIYLNAGTYIMLLNENGKVKWAKNINTDSGNIKLNQLENNKYVIMGYVYDTTIPAEDTVANEEITIEEGAYKIIYTAEGKVESVNMLSLNTEIFNIINGNITYAEPTADGGAIISGGINESVTIPSENTVSGETIILESTNQSTGIIIKIDAEGKVEWAHTTSSSEANSMYQNVVQGEDGKYLAVGIYEGRIVIPAENTANGEEVEISTKILRDLSPNLKLLITIYNEEGKVEFVNGEESATFDNNINIITSGNNYTICTDTKAITVTSGSEKSEPAEKQEIIVQNNKKQYKVTTKVEGEGGEISGRDEDPYETVKYKEDSTKDIIITPKEKYKVKTITVNGEEIEFTPNEDGTVTLNKFVEMAEDKEVIVSFDKKDTKVITHYYIEGTETKLSEDVTKEGKVDEEYTTASAEDITLNYELVSEPENKNGIMTEETIEVIYYYRLKVTDIRINKVWVDNDIQAQRRPESIIVVVKDGDKEVAQKEITKNEVVSGTTNQWATVIENLPKCDEEGNDINYTIEERAKNAEDLKFYKEEIGEITDNQVTITNTFTTPDDKVDVKVSKIWEDNSNENAKRPSSIELVLRNGETQVDKQLVEGTAENTWEHTFTNLPKYDENGQEIVYTVDEQEVEKDDLKFYTKELNGTTVTNTFSVPDERIDIKVNKVWVDNEQQKSRRPESIIAILKQDGKELDRKEINAESGIERTAEDWSVRFEDLPKYDAKGNEINYTVEEAEKNVGDLYFYEGKVEKVNNEVTITNTFTKPEDTTEVKVSKVWEDNNDEAEKRPDSIKLVLKRGSEVVNEEVVEGTGNTWEHTFTDLPKYDENGQEIVYTVDETEVNSGDLQFYTKDLKGTTIINTFTPNTDKIDITVTKDWVDNEKQKERRPNSIIIQVLRAGNVVDSKELPITKTEDKFTVTFKDLPKYDKYNNIINYSIEEVEKAEGDLKFYEGVVSGTTITNTFARPQDTVSIEVNKKWEDQEDVYGKRPSTITLELKVEDKVIKSEVVSKEDDWTYTFERLPKYDDNGQEIIYTVDEKETQADDLFYYTKEVGQVQDKLEDADGSGAKSGNSTITRGMIVDSDEKEATITNKMTKIPGHVIVKYVDINTDEEISDKVDKEGIIGENYDVTEDKKEISGYTLVEEPEEKTGTYTEKEQEKIYYYAKNTKVIVKYLNKLNNEVLTPEPQYEIDGYEGKTYSTEQKTIDGYVFIDSTENTSGTMERDEIVVIYYYAPRTKVIIKYLEKDNTPDDNTDNLVLTPQPQYEINGYVGQDYETEERFITGYTFIEATDNTEGTMTKDEIEVIYYYAKNTKVIVKYLEKDDTPDDNTDNVVLTEEPQYEIEGYEGKDYETEQKEIENFSFVESTNNTRGKMTKDEIEVIYYYAQKTKATVEHIDRETGKVLKKETESGKVGDLFETHAEDFEGYVLVEAPEAPNVLMTKEEQVIKYYYAKISAGVIEKHIDEITGELLNSEEHVGNEGDEYSIPSKNFEGYDLVEEKIPENREGKMTEELIEVKYYYIKKASLRVEYIDTTTGNKLTEDEITEGHENDDYTTSSKDFKGYSLIETPSNANGKLTITKNEDGTYKTETIVTYYYVKQSGGVIEKHIDIITNKVLAKEEHKGNVGDEYDIPAKEFNGYKLVETRLPENAKGQMAEEEIEVDYYYVKLAKVRVEYIDKLTGEKLDEEEIKGYEGDPYETEEKQFDNYDLVEKPSNSTGEMTDKEIVVKYYYSKKAEIEVQYLEKGTNYPLADKEETKGYVGDKYETEQKDIPYYKFVESTTNTNGTMTEEKIIVKYYYQKQIFNLSVDKWLSSVNMNGIVSGAKDFGTKDQLYKMEVQRKKTATADIKFTYRIRISNKGEIEGTVGRITEIIPQGFSFHQEDNNINWEEQNGILITETLKTETIKPGEYKEIEIILRWNKGEENFGNKNNTVMINNLSNPAGFEDSNKEDNSSKSEMLLGIATGLDRNDKIIIVATVQILLAITLGILITYKKKKR